MAEQKKYLSVRIVAGILKLAGGLTFALGLLPLLTGLSMRDVMGGIMGVAMAVVPVFLGLWTYASGEILNILVDIEYNTRITALSRNA